MDPKKELVEALAGVTDEAEMEGLLSEILTPGELKDIILRWQLLRELHRGEPQRKIAAKYGMSLCKITRGSKQLQKNGSITRKLLDKIYKGEME